MDFGKRAKQRCFISRFLRMEGWEGGFSKKGPVSFACRKARKWSLVRQSSSIMQGQLLLSQTKNLEKLGHLENTKIDLASRVFFQLSIALIGKVSMGFGLIYKSGGKNRNH